MPFDKHYWNLIGSYTRYLIHDRCSVKLLWAIPRYIPVTYLLQSSSTILLLECCCLEKCRMYENQRELPSLLVTGSSVPSEIDKLWIYLKISSTRKVAMTVVFWVMLVCTPFFAKSVFSERMWHYRLQPLQQGWLLSLVLSYATREASLNISNNCWAEILHFGLDSIQSGTQRAACVIDVALFFYVIGYQWLQPILCCAIIITNIRRGTYATFDCITK